MGGGGVVWLASLHSEVVWCGVLSGAARGLEEGKLVRVGLGDSWAEHHDKRWGEGS